MNPVTRDDLFGAVAELTEGLRNVELIRDSKVTGITYETMQRSGFKRKNWERKYTLNDARSNALSAAIRIRNAWELLDPMTPERHTETAKTVLENSQMQLQSAIGHLKKVLNECRTHEEQQSADTAARDWLASIGEM